MFDSIMVGEEEVSEISSSVVASQCKISLTDNRGQTSKLPMIVVLTIEDRDMAHEHLRFQ
jgi:hypothetical protein